MSVKVLQLTADIKNPQADRRSKDWNKLTTLPARARFTLHEGRENLYLMSATQRYHFEHERTELAKLILANSIEVAPETFTEMARVYGDDCDDYSFTKAMFALGRITREDFEAVAAYYNEQTD
jgi:hypothetical protein